MAQAKTKHQLQTRICHPFRSQSCQHPVSSRITTFEDLPQSVRMRVYDFALDFIEPTTDEELLSVILGVTGSDLVVHHQHWEAWAECEDLGLVSHTVEEDMLPWFCSKYRVGLDCTAIASLKKESSPLLQILPHCKHIMIRLDEYCVRLFAEGGKAPHTCTSKPSLDLWQLLCHQLSSMSSLDLNLEDSFEDTSYAEAIMEPLKGLNLSSVAVVNSTRYHPAEIIKVIASPARSLMRVEMQKRGPFRYLDLPTEVRQLVLSFTDLVMPPSWKLEWSCDPTPRFSRAHVGMIYCCREQGIISQECQHASYPPCSCFQPPQDLFLVCRQMTEDVRQVFYSSNHFNLARSSHQGRRGPKPELSASVHLEENASPSIALQAFLTKAVPAHCHRYVRKIEFYLPWESEIISFRETLLSEWTQFLEKLSRRMGALTLVIWIDASPVYWWPDYRMLIDHFAAQKVLMEPLRQLKLLKDFFVFTEVEDPEDFISTHDEDHFFIQEHALECLVMGESYDAIERGKLDIDESSSVSETDSGD